MQISEELSIKCLCGCIEFQKSELCYFLRRHQWHLRSPTKPQLRIWSNKQNQFEAFKDLEPKRITTDAYQWIKEESKINFAKLDIEQQVDAWSRKTPIRRICQTNKTIKTTDSKVVEETCQEIQSITAISKSWLYEIESSNDQDTIANKGWFDTYWA